MDGKRALWRLIAGRAGELLVLSHLDLDGAKPNAWDEWRLVHFFCSSDGHGEESEVERS